MIAEKECDDSNEGSFCVGGWNCRLRDDLLLLFFVKENFLRGMFK